MLPRLISALRLLGAFLAVLGVSGPVSSSPTFPMPGNYTHAQLQLPFIENAGQVNNTNIKFYTQAVGATLYITRQGDIYYSLPKPDNEQQTQGWVLKESLSGARRVNVTGKNRTTTKVTYLKGTKASAWKTGISAYEHVRLGEVYPGVELELHAHDRSVEKLFYIKPTGDSGKIRIKIEGAQDIAVNDAGELVVTTGLGELKFAPPFAYQDHQGEKQQVPVAYTVAGTHYGFVVGDYDKTKPLIIDPLLASTFVGGSGGDVGNAMAMDPKGNVYVGGTTFSLNFPTHTGAHRTTLAGASDGFVFKLDAELKQLLAATYIGGSLNDQILAIAHDGAGNLYVAGGTTSSDFPTTPKAYLRASNGGGFLAKLNDDLSTLLASTYVTARDVDVDSVSLDGSGSVYIAGMIHETEPFLATAGVYDSSHNGSFDVYISKLDTNLSQLQAATLLGGSDYDGLPTVVADGLGKIYVSGDARSANFPVTAGAYDTTHNGLFDSFVAILDGNLQALQASTFLGGSGDERIPTMVLDGSGNVYIAGRTTSPNFPTTPGAYERIYRASDDVFVSRLTADLKTLTASTYLGGNNWDFAKSLALAPDGSLYILGSTTSVDFPTTPEAYDPTYNGLPTTFLSRFSGSLDKLLASTYFGSQFNNTTNAIGITGTGEVLVTGQAYASFPVTPGAYDTTYNGDGDVFVAKFDANFSNPVPQPDITITPTQLDFSYINVGNVSPSKTITVSNRGSLDLVLGALAVGGTSPSEYSIQNDRCSNATLPTGISCTFSVVFAPIFVGTKNATIAVRSNDPDSPAISITLYGNGTQSCSTNLGCGFSEFCQKPDGQCGAIGSCLSKPQYCLAVYMPVCGCDGRTYSNSCVAAGAGVSVAYGGVCLTFPVISGFWPGSGGPGTLVFVFGNNFVPYATSSLRTTVKVNGVDAPIVQVLDKTLLFFLVPVGGTAGPITVTTPSGTATSPTNFGAGTTGLQINGIWPSQARVGAMVFVFGNGFDPNLGATKVSINGVAASVYQVIDPTMLFFMVPSGAASGPVQVTTPAGSVVSTTSLTIVP